MDTDQKAKHQPGGMMGGLGGVGQTSEMDERKRNFRGLQDHLDPSEFLA